MPSEWICNQFLEGSFKTACYLFFPDMSAVVLLRIKVGREYGYLCLQQLKEIWDENGWFGSEMGENYRLDNEFGTIVLAPRTFVCLIAWRS